MLVQLAIDEPWAAVTVDDWQLVPDFAFVPIVVVEVVRW
jgi:hypothetical protein